MKLYTDLQVQRVLNISNVLLVTILSFFCILTTNISAKAQNNDIQTINALNEQGKKIFSENIDSAIVLFDKAYRQSVAAHNKLFVYRTAINMGLAFGQKHDYAQALHYFRLAEKETGEVDNGNKMNFYTDLCCLYIKADSTTKAQKYIDKILASKQQTTDTAMLCNNLQQVALAYYEVENYAEAITFFLDATNHIAVNYPIPHTADLYYNLGLTLQATASYTTAIQWFEMALTLAQSNGYRAGEIAALNNIAQIMAETNQMKSALEYFDTALTICKATNDTQHEAWITANVGKVYLNLNEHNKAITMLNRALALQQESEAGTKNKGVIYLNLGEAHYHENRQAEALRYFDKVLADTLQGRDTENHAKAWYYKGEINATNGQIAAAKNYYAQSLGTAEKLHLRKLVSGIYLALSKLSEQENDMRAATMYLKQYTKINDEIFSASLQSSLSGLQAEYDLYKKNAEMQQLKNESEVHRLQLKNIKQQYIALAVGTLLLLVFLMIGSVLYTRKNTAYRKLVSKNMALAQNEKATENSICKEADTQQQALPKTTATPTDNSELIARIKCLLADPAVYTQQGITSTDVAEMLDSNRSYLSQVINNQMNTSFNQLLNEQRVLEAIRLLSMPDQQMTIEGIATTVGFASKSSFNPAFKKYTGVTPSFFREQTLQNNQNTE